jgi:Methyltransferase domain
MNCHTLEHLPDFKVTLSEIMQALDFGGFFYLEVPMDGFRTHRFHQTHVYQKYLSALSRSRKVFVVIDLFSGLYRQIFQRIPLLGIVKQSEHINYFNENSLTMLLREMGFNVLSIQGPDLDFKQGKIRLGRIGILSQKRVA